MSQITIASIEAFAFRVPVKTPIKVAFGTFRDRPFVLVRVRDSDGAEGWGEAWANWPAVGAEHRARLVVDIGERLVGRSFESPADAFHELSRSLEVLVLQTGEVGPIAQAIAGIDIALWDLSARRAGLPLHRHLGGRAARLGAGLRHRHQSRRARAVRRRALGGRPSRVQAEDRIPSRARRAQPDARCARRSAPLQ